MAKQDLTQLTVAQLLKLASTEPALTAEIVEEIEGRKGKATFTIDWNSAGQVFLQEPTATTLSSKGTLYRGQANIAPSILALIVSDDAGGADVRKRIREHLAQPKDVIAARVAEKKLKKLAREEVETQSAS